MAASSFLLGITLMAASPLLAVGQTLEKPALTPNLDYLEQGNIDNLSPTQSTNDQWGAGWIPSDCKSIAKNEGKNPDDFEIYNVHYDDVRHWGVWNTLVSLIFITQLYRKNDKKKKRKKRRWM